MSIYLIYFLVILVVIYLSLKYGKLYDAITMLLFRGAPYVVSDTSKLKTMIKLADLKKSDSVADLGSGDGSVVFEGAKYAKSVVGYEINPFAFGDALRKLKRKDKKIQKKVVFRKENFMNADLSEFDVIFVYGVGYAMKPLEKKLKKELKPGARIISNYFEFPDFEKSNSEDGVHLYIVC